MTRPFVILLLACATCALACSIGEAPIDAGLGISPDAGPGRGIVMIGQITDARFATRISGARVCVRDHPEVACTETNDFGRYALIRLPEDADLIVTMEHDGFRNIARLLSTEGGPSPYLYRDVMVPIDDWVRIRRDQGLGREPHAVFLRSYDAELQIGYPAQGLSATLVGGVGPIYVETNLFLNDAGEATVHEGGGALFHSVPSMATATLTCAGAPVDVEPWAGWAGPEPGTVRVVALDGYDVVAAEAPCRTGPRCSYRDTEIRYGRSFLMRVVNASAEPIEVIWASPTCELWPTPEISLAPGEQGDISVLYGWALHVVNDAGEDLADFYASDHGVPDGEAAIYVHE